MVLKVEKQKSIVMNMSTGGLDMENIPAEWEEMFENMGLGKEDMKSAEMMQYVLEEAIIYQAKKSAE